MENELKMICDFLIGYEYCGGFEVIKAEKVDEGRWALEVKRTPATPEAKEHYDQLVQEGLKKGGLA